MGGLFFIDLSIGKWVLVMFSDYDLVINRDMPKNDRRTKLSPSIVEIYRRCEYVRVSNRHCGRGIGYQEIMIMMLAYKDSD